MGNVEAIDITKVEFYTSDTARFMILELTIDNM